MYFPSDAQWNRMNWHVRMRSLCMYYTKFFWIIQKLPSSSTILVLNSLNIEHNQIELFLFFRDIIHDICILIQIGTFRYIVYWRMMVYPQLSPNVIGFRSHILLYFILRKRFLMFLGYILLFGLLYTEYLEIGIRYLLYPDEWKDL